MNRLLETTVRPDWQQIAQEQADERLRLWRSTQIAVSLSTLVVLLIARAAPNWPWQVLFHLALVTLVLWGLPLWSILRSRFSAIRAALYLLIACLGLLTLASLSYATAPAALSGFRLPGPGLVLLGALSPLATGAILAWGAWRFPHQARQLGLIGDRWLLSVVLGIAAGIALGLHLWLTIGTARGLAGLHLPATSDLAWLLFYLVGLRSLGEELLLRGLSYSVHFRDATEGFLRPALQIAFLNLFLYLVPIFPVTDPTLRLTIIFYAALMAITTTYLRHRLASLWPGLACNVTFGVFLFSLIL